MYRSELLSDVVSEVYGRFQIESLHIVDRQKPHLVLRLIVKSAEVLDEDVKFRRVFQPVRELNDSSSPCRCGLSQLL